MGTTFFAFLPFPLHHKSPHFDKVNCAKYFLLLLFVGATFSSMQQNFFALSREGQYFYQDIAYCKYFGLALSFAKTKSSMLGSTLTKGIALQNFKTT